MRLSGFHAVIAVAKVEVLTAGEDGAAELGDSALLDRSTELGRALFSYDDDLLDEAARRQAHGIAFSRVIYARQLHVPIGICVHDLELIATVGEPEELRSQVIYLPI